MRRTLRREETAPGLGQRIWRADRVLLHGPQGPAAPSPRGHRTQAGPGRVTPRDGPHFGGLTGGHRVTPGPALSRLGPIVQQGALRPEAGLWARGMASVPASPSPSSRAHRPAGPTHHAPFPGSKRPITLSSVAAQSPCEQLLGQRNSHFCAIKQNSACSLKRNAVDQAKPMKPRTQRRRVA